MFHAAFFIYPYSYFKIMKDSFIEFTGAHLNRHILCLSVYHISVVNHFSVCYFMPWIDIKFLILSIFNFQLWKFFNINRFQGQTSFPTAPPPTCPPDKPRVYCFVDPCQVTTCPAHPEARCVSDFCGGCNARFFDDEGNEVTKSCSKYGYSIIKTEHRDCITDQQYFLSLNAV